MSGLLKKLDYCLVPSSFIREYYNDRRIEKAKGEKEFYKGQYKLEMICGIACEVARFSGEMMVLGTIMQLIYP